MFYPYEELMEYTICERFRGMPQTALFNRYLPNVTAAAIDIAKQVLVYFFGDGDHSPTIQDTILTTQFHDQLQSQMRDSHEKCLQKLKLCGLAGRFINMPHWALSHTLMSSDYTSWDVL